MSFFYFFFVFVNGKLKNSRHGFVKGRYEDFFSFTPGVNTDKHIQCNKENVMYAELFMEELN